MASSCCPLQSILDLCQSLHHGGGHISSQSQQGSSSSALSLQQLVPVHATLIQATRRIASSSESSSSSSSTQPPLNATVTITEESLSLTEALDACCSSRQLSPNDRALCDSILLLKTTRAAAAAEDDHDHHHIPTRDNEAAVLLTLQYLLDSLSLSSSSSFDNGNNSLVLSGLAAIVIPFLMDASSLTASDELTEALLSAVFSQSSTVLGNTAATVAIDLDDDDDVLLASVVGQVVAVVPVSVDVNGDTAAAATGIRHARACRILERLFQHATATTNQDSNASAKSSSTSIILEAITNKIIQGMEYAVSKPVDLAVTLRPITNHLLPVLLLGSSSNDDDSSIHVDRIWKSVWKSFASLQSQKDLLAASPLSVLTVVTTVLCTILPSLLDRELAIVSLGNGAAATANDAATTTAASALPVNQPALWELILLCLNQGMQVPKRASWVEDSWKTQNVSAGAQGSRTAASSLLLRRRGLYLLRITTTATTTASNNNNNKSSSLLNWQKYVACFETLEMEFEPHLVDQVWETVAELASQITDNKTQEEVVVPPRMSWDWMSVLLARVISSHEAPILRKLGVYRLFKGQAGVIVNEAATAQDAKNESGAGSIKKKKTRNTQAKSTSQRGISLRLVSVDFILGVVVPSFDSLAASVGTVMHLEENRKVVRDDMTPLLSKFLDSYVQVIADDPDMLQEFFAKLCSPDVVCKLHRKTTVLVFSCVAESIRKRTDLNIPVKEETLKVMVKSFHTIFTLGSVVITYREALLEAVATMLARSQAVGNVSPLTIMSVLALYPLPVPPETSTQSVGSSAIGDTETSWIDQDATFAALRKWLLRLGQGQGSSWAGTVGGAVATAFVDGQLLAPQEWDPITSSTDIERGTGKAIVIFCTLTDTAAASELLWPAIHKGLSHAPAAMMGSTWPKADRVSRALLLLECGCKLQVLSGMGNGDLVIDRKTQQMMPPPPTVEVMLANGVGFSMRHLHALLLSKEPGTSGGATRSNDATRVSATFAAIISLLRTLHEGFPSSMTVSNAVNGLLTESIEALSSSEDNRGGSKVQRTALVYATLSCGAELDKSALLSTCELMLALQFSDTVDAGGEEQFARSVFQYAKWGALSCLLPGLFQGSPAEETEVRSFIDRVLDETSNAVEGMPTTALLPLFQCVVVATRGRFSPVSEKGVAISEELVRALFVLWEDCKSSSDAMYMLDETAALLFQPHLLLDESVRLAEDIGCSAPLRDAFRRLMKTAGNKRTHVSRAVLCRIASSWLCTTDGGGGGSDAGVAAIPYREDIAALLLHKEDISNEASSNQSAGRGGEAEGVLTVPKYTHESSMARAFLLVFLSKLPDVGSGLHPRVLTDLLHDLIFRLLDVTRPSGRALVMLGTQEYCLKMRAWQALCMLARFVTADIAEQVSAKVFESLSEQIHGQIRYFIEVFTLQCSRAHPAIFGNELVDQITRQELSLQQVSSLMIIGGNLIVGQYELDFFRQFEENRETAVRLNLVLSGVIPWLSSTQGFSRAIAQLLVHKLIPLVVDIKSPSTGPGTEDKDWYLRSLYKFLEDNSEMSRLRKKQTKFFARYELDSVCTPEGILSIPVDEGGESEPVHMVDLIKQCLQDVYDEAHSHDTPTWKQVEGMLSQQEPASKPLVTKDGDLVNFQRKIIPMDALNLALEEMREKRLRNAADRKKQELIVCASLVDKVPNLGGLARTAEIFAADRLVIPDLRVTKMDNFKSLSVTAGDWIEIEECSEENLLSWLRSRKEEGYYIVGLEQTSSSLSLGEFTFPDRPVVLLLGKEKEGIPVEFLQVVDQCLEIPQLGVIRSLNVHVSGAIAIWEHTRQKIAQGKLTLD